MKINVILLILLVSCAGPTVIPRKLERDGNIVSEIKRIEKRKDWLVEYKEGIEAYSTYSSFYARQNNIEQRRKRLIQLRDILVYWLDDVVHKRKILHYKLKDYVKDEYTKVYNESRLKFFEMDVPTLSDTELRVSERVIAQEFHMLIRDYALLTDLESDKDFEKEYLSQVTNKEMLSGVGSLKVEFSSEELIKILSYPYSLFVRGGAPNGKTYSRGRLDLASDALIKKILELKRINAKDMNLLVGSTVNFLKDRGLISKRETSDFQDYFISCRDVMIKKIKEKVVSEKLRRKELKYVSYFDLTDVEILHVLDYAKTNEEIQLSVLNTFSRELLDSRSISRNRFLTLFSKLMLDTEIDKRDELLKVRKSFEDYLKRKSLISKVVAARDINFRKKMAKVFFEDSDESPYLHQIFRINENSFEKKLLVNTLAAVDTIYDRIGSSVREEDLYFKYQETDFKKLDIRDLAQNGTPEAIQRAFDLGFKIDIPNEYGITPLMLAIDAKRIGNAMKLIRLGASIRKENVYGDDPIKLSKKNKLNSLTSYLEKLLIKIRESETAKESFRLKTPSS